MDTEAPNDICNFCGRPANTVPFLITSGVNGNKLCMVCILASAQLMHAKLLAGEMLLSIKEQSPIAPPPPNFDPTKIQPIRGKK